MDTKLKTGDCALYGLANTSQEGGFKQGDVVFDTIRKEKATIKNQAKNAFANSEKVWCPEYGHCKSYHS